MLYLEFVPSERNPFSASRLRLGFRLSRGGLSDFSVDSLFLANMLCLSCPEFVQPQSQRHRLLACSIRRLHPARSRTRAWLFAHQHYWPNMLLAIYYGLFIR